MCAKKRIATKALAALLLAGACTLALAAQVAGTVIQLSGPLLAKKADGKVKALALKSEVEQGDTLVSEKNTYAQIKFVDNSEITLMPGTTFKVEAFAFDAGKPDGDSANFNLVKGGLRSITGLLGKRNKEKFQLKTPTATIGIRGTTFTADYVPTLAAQQAGPPALAPGLYVAVSDGMIYVSNNAGAHAFSAGQFGFVRSPTIAPVIVPSNPNVQFSPPPAFSATTVTGKTAAGGASAAVDCEVR
jgi:hypothetical protein